MVVYSETFDEPTCNGKVHVENVDVIVKGRIHENVDRGNVIYFAAAPMDRRASFTGSGLPFANKDQAFYDSSNQGTIKLDMQNQFEIRITMPNSYYNGLGTVLIPPTLFLKYTTHGKERNINIKLSNGVPYRMLTYPSSLTMPRRDAQFYTGLAELPVRTQEQILRSSGYPENNNMASNFWGNKPPV